MPYITQPSILLAVLVLTLAMIVCSIRCGATRETFWHPLRRLRPRCGVYDGHPMYDHHCKAGSYVDPTCRSGCAAYVPSLGFSTCCKSSCCIRDGPHHHHFHDRALHYPHRFTRLVHSTQPPIVPYQHYRVPKRYRRRHGSLIYVK